MSRMRRLAIVLLTASVITSAIYATGAFTSLTAERDANIQVAGDAAGYLSIKPSEGANGEYASLRGGKLHVSVGGVLGQQGGGVNRDAVTVVRDIFTITNQGSQSVGIWLTDETAAVTFTGGPQATTLEGKDHAITLQPGDTLVVGLTVDTRGANAAVSELTAVAIHADTEVAGRSVERQVADDDEARKETKSIARSTPDHEQTKQVDQDNHKQSSDNGEKTYAKNAVHPVMNTLGSQEQSKDSDNALEKAWNGFTGFIGDSYNKAKKEFSKFVNGLGEFLRNLPEMATDRKSVV